MIRTIAASLIVLFGPAIGWADSMKVHFIDVGQGDATLFEFPCGAMLVDTGGESAGVHPSVEHLEEYLDEFFAGRPDLDETLDVLVLTHPHIDHTRGAEMVVDEFTVERLVDNSEGECLRCGRNQPPQCRRCDSGEPEQVSVREWAQTPPTIPYTGVESSAISANGGLVLDDIAEGGALGGTTPTVTVLSGSNGGDLHGGANDDSVVVRVDFGDSSVLLTGDLEEEGIELLLEKFASHPELLDVDVYQAGHHGSRNGTTPELAAAMSPKLAVFSVSDPTRTRGQWTAYKYGHPNYRVVRILTSSAWGVSCNRTRMRVPVGVRGGSRPTWDHGGSSYGPWLLQSALFSTGWDGDIVVSAHDDGELEVTTEDYPNPGFDCP